MLIPIALSLRVLAAIHQSYLKPTHLPVPVARPRCFAASGLAWARLTVLDHTESCLMYVC